jgi:DNA-binding winged helix-turn-helix (wHTH) protein
MIQNLSYVFGSYRLETDTQLLWKEESSTNLQPKVYDLLLYFLHHSGHLVSREKLLDTVWNGTIVEDTALRQTINALRKALHDDSKTPRYISTVYKRGYRFIPEVKIEYGFEGNNSQPQVVNLNYHPHSENPADIPEDNYELAQLCDAFLQATYGNRRLIFLNGERGSGKTALIENFLFKISDAELEVLRAHCVPIDKSFEPFLPLLEALEQRCREPFCGRSFINYLHQVAPTWVYHMPNAQEPETIANLINQKDTQSNLGRMLREGADFFESLGNKSTFVLILDNSQWSDTFTLDLMNLIMFRNTSAKLLIIISYRPNEEHAIGQRLKEMQEEFCHRGLSQKLSLLKERSTQKEKCLA